MVIRLISTERILRFTMEALSIEELQNHWGRNLRHAIDKFHGVTSMEVPRPGVSRLEAPRPGMPKPVVPRLGVPRRGVPRRLRLEARGAFTGGNQT